MDIRQVKQLGMPSLRGAIVIAGTGTDMISVLEASVLGFITEVGYWLVIGTKREAKGLAIAKEKFGLETCVVNKLDEVLFHQEMTKVLVEHGIDFVMMLGNHRYIYPIVIDGRELDVWRQAHPEPVMLGEDTVEIRNHNIHPALPKKHGGTKKVGLDVHIHVLEWLLDELDRRGYDPDKRYYTTIVVHHAHAQRYKERPTIVYGKKQYDIGDAITSQQVTIPREIIEGLRSEVAQAEALGDRWSTSFHREKALERYAKQLQQHVLRFEWIILPSAVRAIAWEILTERCGHYPAVLMNWTE